MASGSPQRKMRKLVDSTAVPEDTTENRDYDAETRKALEAIDSCQNEIDAINEQASEDILKIEQKFNKLRKPHYDKRNDLISKIPNFWITAFVNHPDLSAVIDDSEEDCLHHLTRLNVEEFEDIRSGYKIEFHFNENPYFDNAVLTKEFHLGTLDDPTSQSTPIKFKDGMNLAQNNEPRSIKGRKRHFEHKSFFAWFNDHIDPASDDIAETIKDDLWHNPLQYYLVPDIEIENGADEEEASEGDEDAIPLDETEEENKDINKQETDDNATD